MTGPEAIPVGRVVALHRYAVKSMQGEPLAAAELDDLGMVGDRVWAVGDAERGVVLSAKREPRLLEATAVVVAGHDRPHISLPDGSVLEPDDDPAAVDAALTAWLGRPVVLRRAEDGPLPEPGAALPADAPVYEMSFDVDDEDRDLFAVPMRPGRFLDLCPVHLLTTASIAAAAKGHPDGVWDVHRFRPTVLVELDDPTPGFVEDGWVDRRVHVGSAVVRPIMPTIRCVMTTRAQPAHGLGRDLGIVKAVNRGNGGNLGTYAEIDRPGTVAVGDAVALEAEPAVPGA